MALERLTVESCRSPTDSLEYSPYSARTPSTRSQDVLDPPTTISSTIPVKCPWRYMESCPIAHLESWKITTTNVLTPRSTVFCLPPFWTRRPEEEAQINYSYLNHRSWPLIYRDPRPVVPSTEPKHCFLLTEQEYCSPYLILNYLQMSQNNNTFPARRGAYAGGRGGNNPTARYHTRSHGCPQANGYQMILPFRCQSTSPSSSSMLRW